MENQEIYFHVGLGKNASTYLQYEFFPKLKDIHYIQRTKYRSYESLIPKIHRQKILISREFDQQLERELRKFSKHYPQTRIIIIFRRQEDWIASQYRRYIKNGGHRSFTEFINVDDDTGLWKLEHLNFPAQLEIVRKYFDTEPLVLIYEELRQDPYRFFDRIAGFTGTSYERNAISLTSVHRSYREKELKIMRRVAPFIFFNELPGRKKGRLINWLHRRSRLLICYMILYPSKLIPNSFLDKKPLIDPSDKKKVRDFFAVDWRKILNAAGNPPDVK